MEHFNAILKTGLIDWTRPRGSPPAPLHGDRGMT